MVLRATRIAPVDSIAHVSSFQSRLRSLYDLWPNSMDLLCLQVAQVPISQHVHGNPNHNDHAIAYHHDLVLRESFEGSNFRSLCR